MMRYCLVLALGLVWTGSASASNWADALFDDLSRDFGTVPRGPTLVHPFRLVNKTNGPITISSVRVSCGCTSAHALQNTLAPGQAWEFRRLPESRGHLFLPGDGWAPPAG